MRQLVSKTIEIAHIRHFKSDCPTPPLLLTCLESFKVASKSYTPTCFSIGPFPQTYFNHTLDTLYLDWESCSHDYESEIMFLLRSFACPDEFAKIEPLALQDQIPGELPTATNSSYATSLQSSGTYRN